MPRTTHNSARKPLTLVAVGAGVAAVIAACGSTTGPAGANPYATASNANTNPGANIPATSAAAAETTPASAPSSAATTGAPILGPTQAAGGTIASTPANTPAVANATDLSKQPIAAAGTGPAPTGLVIKDLVVGKGTPAVATDSVNVKYAGTIYATGKSFDASWTDGAANQTANFPLSGVVPGFAQGIVGMKPGGRREIVIPPALGYGANPPSGSGISATDTLVFVVDYIGASTS